MTMYFTCFFSFHFCHLNNIFESSLLLSPEILLLLLKSFHTFEFSDLLPSSFSFLVSSLDESTPQSQLLTNIPILNFHLFSQFITLQFAIAELTQLLPTKLILANFDININGQKHGGKKKTLPEIVQMVFRAQ